MREYALKIEISWKHDKIQAVSDLNTLQFANCFNAKIMLFKNGSLKNKKIFKQRPHDFSKQKKIRAFRTRQINPKKLKNDILLPKIIQKKINFKNACRIFI